VKTIQLPQSIWFRQRENLRSFAAIVEQHRDLTLLLRDAASVKLAADNFDAPARLAPDIAFGLGPIERPHPPSSDIVWLRREDRESLRDPWSGDADDPIPLDWSTATPEQAVGDRTGRWLLRFHGWLSQGVAAHPWMWRPLVSTYDPLATRRLAYGCMLLARGRVVVTDRLHGVILSLLMGIPVVAVDNSTGKLSSFIETWLTDAPSVRLAPDHRAGLALARSLLA
jgi:exopolysaccharide biosynthesis protein PssK